MGLRVKSRLALLFIILMVAAVWGLAYWGSPTPTGEVKSTGHSPPPTRRVVVEPARPAPNFSLLDQDSARRSLSDWRGRLVVLSFIYTRCPTICPLLADMFLRVQEGLEGKVPGAVVLVFVTVDPEYDTPKVLKAWTEAWRGRWFALTGSLEECRAVWAGYGIAVLKDPEKAEVGHTVKTVLIDGEGAVRLEYYGIPEARMVLEDIYRLLG